MQSQRMVNCRKRRFCLSPLMTLLHGQTQAAGGRACELSSVGMTHPRRRGTGLRAVPTLSEW